MSCNIIQTFIFLCHFPAQNEHFRLNQIGRPLVRLQQIMIIVRVDQLKHVREKEKQIIVLAVIGRRAPIIACARRCLDDFLGLNEIGLHLQDLERSIGFIQPVRGYVDLDEQLMDGCKAHSNSKSPITNCFNRMEDFSWTNLRL